LDWYDGDILHTPNSLWGELDLTVTPHPTDCYYVNVVADAGSGPSWIIQNFPVFPASAGAPNTQAVYFNLEELGISSGTDLSSMNALMAVDGAPLAAAPSGPMAPATVGNYVQRAGGHNVEAPFAVPTPVGFKATGAATNLNQHSDMPSVQEHVKNCITGSYARSIKWLDIRYDLKNLAAGRTAQDVYNDLNSLGVGHGSGKGKTEEEMLTLKANYLKNLDNRFYTKFMDVSDYLGEVPGATEIKNVPLVSWLYEEMETEDVELFFDGHCVTITGIYTAGGEIFLKFRDDEHQSNPPDTKGDSKEKSGLLTLRDGKYYFNGGRVDYIVSESPEPGTMVLLAVGWMLLLRRRR